MKRFRVDVPPTVATQIDRQLLHIAEDSIDNALAWEGRLRGALLAIGEAPVHAVDEDVSDRLGFPIRKVVFEGTYVIHYHVDEEAGVVRIVNFRHGATLF